MLGREARPDRIERLQQPNNSAVLAAGTTRVRVEKRWWCVHEAGVTTQPRAWIYLGPVTGSRATSTIHPPSRGYRSPQARARPSMVTMTSAAWIKIAIASLQVSKYSVRQPRALLVCRIHVSAAAQTWPAFMDGPALQSVTIPLPPRSRDGPQMS